MRRFSAVILLLASCSATEKKDIETVRQQFESWVKSAAAGDADKTLAMFSDAKKSEWLYDRLEENDPFARRWRGDLTGPARTDLDLWWGIAHTNRNGRTEPLRPSVLDHPTFRNLFKEYFVQTSGAIKAQFSKLEISNVYGDDTGITVAVKCGLGAPTELYGLVFEHDGWKIDSYRQPLTSQK